MLDAEDGEMGRHGFCPPLPTAQCVCVCGGGANFWRRGAVVQRKGTDPDWGQGGAVS